jgi:hypothetical protein
MTAPLGEPHIGLVVEGVGDVRATPLLLRKHLQALNDYRDVLGKPVPFHGRGNATAAGGIEGYTAVAGSRPGCKGVLVVLDSDGDCVASLGPDLLERAQSRLGIPVRLALAEVDYEDWIFASAETLELGGLTYDPARRGKNAIADSLKVKYVKPTWQPRLTSRMDIATASRRSASLDRALRRFDELLGELPRTQGPE